MQIIYQKQIESFEKKTNFPHLALSTKVKAYIIKRKLKQKSYLSSTYGAYFFIYFNNGDRIDVLMGD